MTDSTRKILSAAAAALLCLPGLSSGQEVDPESYSLDASAMTSGGGAWLGGGDYAARGALGQPVAHSGLSKGGTYTTRSGFYSPAYMAFQKGIPVSLGLQSGAVSLSLPADAITDRQVFEIGINRTELSGVTGMDPEYPFLVEKEKVEEANRKKMLEEGPWARFDINDMTEMYIYDEQSVTRDPLTKNGVLTMKYRDTNDDGVVDGTEDSDAPIRIDTLDAWVLDERTRLWTMLPNLGVDQENKTISVNFRGPGAYNMIGALASTTERVFSYPVPFRPFGPNAGNGPGQTGTESDGIMFTNLPQKGEIAIYTLSGQLVWKRDIAYDAGIGNMRWLVKTNGGSRVASGVYIWRVTSGSSSKTGKLMIIW